MPLKERVRGKHIKNCYRGHPQNEQNTRFTKDGYRVCKVCVREDARRRYHEKNPEAEYRPREHEEYL